MTGYLNQNSTAIEPIVLPPVLTTNFSDLAENSTVKTDTDDAVDLVAMDAVDLVATEDCTVKSNTLDAVDLVAVEDSTVKTDITNAVTPVVTKLENIHPGIVDAIDLAAMENNIVRSDKLMAYVLTYRSLANKTAESALKMCQIVYEAKEKLMTVEFEAFRCLTNLERDPSSISKMCTIGERFDQLIEHAHRLPPAWTTLYLIARLPIDELYLVINGSRLHPSLSANELKEIVPRLSGRRKNSVPPKITTAATATANTTVDLFLIRSDRVPDSRSLATFRTALVDLCSEFQCELVDY